MNGSCSVIMDLLPLYAEKLTGEESDRLVEAHLEQCPTCRAKLEELRRPAVPPMEDAAPVKLLKKELRRRRLRTAGIAALAVFLILFTVLARSVLRSEIAYRPGLLRVETAVTEQGLLLAYDSHISGLTGEDYYDDVTGEVTVYLQCWENTLDSVLRPNNQLNGEESEMQMTLYPIPDRVIYGYGAQQTLLWGEPMNGGVEILPRLALAYYAMLAAALALPLGLLWFFFRKKKAGSTLRQLFLAPTSWLVGQLLVKGVRTTSYFLPEDLVLIGIAALAAYALITLLLAALRQRRADRS